MLGFDAIGRLALGQSSRPLVSYVLTAVAGSFAITGVAVVFNTKLAATTAAYTITGYDSIPNVLYPSNAGAFVITGVDATLTLNQLWTEATRQDETWTEKVYGS